MSGKLINKELYEFLKLAEEKQGLDESGMVRKIGWKCDLKGAAEEIEDFYFGERDCVILVFGTVKYESAGRIKNNHVRVENTLDIPGFMKMIHKENVLFAVIDYLYGLENVGNGLNVADVRTMGREAFCKLREEDQEIPVYILDGSSGHSYTEKEKNTLVKRGAGGFIERKYFRSQLEDIYQNVSCQVVMETLAARRQVLTYETKKNLTRRPMREASFSAISSLKQQWSPGTGHRCCPTICVRVKAGTIFMCQRTSKRSWNFYSLSKES